MKLVIHDAAQVWGGNEKWLATLAAGLIARGHQVVVSCRASGPVREELERRGIPTSAVRPGTYGDVVRGVRFALWLRSQRPDAVLLTSWKGLPWGAWAARRAGVPRVVVRLGIVRTPDGYRHALPFRRWVDAMIVNAREIRDAWIEGAPWFPADRVHVVHNGIRLHGAPAPGVVEGIRAGVGAGPDTLLVVGVGHVARRKGFDILLAALARVADPGVHAVIVGSGAEMGALRAQAARLGLADRVHWLGHRDDVPDILAACDVFVLSSRNEGMANVMLEAMSVGMPVVGTDISGVRAALGATPDHPPAGWIVPPEDPSALGAALDEVLSDLRSGAGEATRRSAEAHRRVREWFSVERMVEEAERVLFPDVTGTGEPGTPRG